MRPDSPSDPDVRVVDVLGIPVGITDRGQGPVVVALHGLPGSGRDFRWLGAALEPDHRVVRIDLPGFGVTPARVGRSLAARADFVASVLDALGLDRVIVLGHSMGGPVATAVAARFPERALGLALLASVGRTPHATLRSFPIPPRVASGLLSVGALRRRALPRLRAAFEAMGFRGFADEQIVETLHLVAATSLRDHRHNIEALRVPTLVAWTADDRQVEDAIGQDLYWACPAGPRVRFGDGGHNLQKTRATELADALRAWIGGLEARLAP